MKDDILSEIAEDSIIKIGKVVSVQGRAVGIKVDKSKNTSHLLYRGELLKNVSVGGYVKIAKGFTRIVGKVEGEDVAEDKYYTNRKEYVSGKEKIDRTLKISLLGFFRGKVFERGIKEMPLIDNECFLLKKDEFERLHDFIQAGDQPITIGALSFEQGQQIRVGINALFASHIGIFGNTGSGKSYTLAKIYRELFVAFKDRAKFRRNARFFLIDFNGEYVSSDKAHDKVIIEKKYKHAYSLSTRLAAGGDKYPVSDATLNDPEFWIVFLEATEKTQMPFIRRAINNSYVAQKLKDAEQFKALIDQILFDAVTSVDRNVERMVVINFLKELDDALGGNQSLKNLFNDYTAHLKYHSNQNKFYYQSGGQTTYADQDVFRQVAITGKVNNLEIDLQSVTPIDAVRLQIVIQYYSDVIRGFSNRDHLAPLIKRLDKRIDDLKKVIEVKNDAPRSKPLTILSLKDVNMTIRKVLPLLICKKLYNEKKADPDERKYLNIIVDEAHNILSENSERESEQWKDYRLETFEEIIKEGRKFGVFLTLASQRPSDISPTIISQLHNYFLHRLINNEDINAVKQTISYLDRVSFEYLPLLPTGTCIFAGLLPKVPIVLDVGRIEPADHEPKNKTITLIDKWS